MLLEYDNPYWRDNPEHFGRLYRLVEGNYRNHVRTITRKPKIRSGCRKVSYPDTWDIYCWINDVLPKLRDPIYSMKTKIYWILHGIQDFPACANKTHGRHTLEGKNVITSTLGYGHHVGQHELYCCDRCKYEDEKFAKAIIERLRLNFQDPDWFEQWYTRQYETRVAKYGSWIDYSLIENSIRRKYGVKCVFQDKTIKSKAMDWLHRTYGEHYENVFQVPEIKRKSEQTLLRRTGFRNIMQAPETKAKVRKTLFEKYGTYSVSSKYIYEGMSFDSGWELCFYEYSADMGKTVEYPSGVQLPYKDSHGNVRHYYPDFKVDGELVEIKGKQFFREDGTMYCPYRCSDLSDVEYENLCRTFELKRQCMVANNVRIMTETEMRPVLEYIAGKHGVDSYMDYCRRFARSK